MCNMANFRTVSPVGFFLSLWMLRSERCAEKVKVNNGFSVGWSGERNAVWGVGFPPVHSRVSLTVTVDGATGH